MGVSDVIKAYERLSAADRMELMCRLFDRSLPCEIRFMCSVLHDIASRDHESLQKLENHVNKLDTYKHQKDLSDVRGQICHTLALIHPDNRAVANTIYSLLNSSNVLYKLNNSPTDSVQLDEYRLLYTMAVNHPVFTYEQRDELRKNFLSELDVMAKELWKKEKNRSRTSLADSDSGKDEKTSSGRRIKPSPIAEIDKDSSICLVQCEVKGVHRRAADGRFVYTVEVKWSNNMVYLVRRTYGEFFAFQTELLNLFPEEAGEKKNRKGRKVRVIPYLPGKKLFSKASGQEIAEKRLPEMAKYTRDLMKLSSHVTQSDHVINFFMHHAQDLKENGFPLQKMTTPDDVASESGSVESIDYSQRSSSFHHSRNQATNIPLPNLPKHHSLPTRGKDSGGGQTETLKSSQQNMFTSSPLYVNFEDLSNANSNSSIATSESQENCPDEDEEDGLQPLREFEGQEWKAFTSVRSDSIIAIEAPPRIAKQQPIAEEAKEIGESGEQDTQHDDILNFCADEIAAGAAGSNFSTPQGTPSISPSHTPTLTRTPTPQGISHVGPIHPVLVAKTSGNSTQFTYQNPPSGGHPFVNASPLPSPHIKKYGSSTSVQRDPYEFETLFLWLKDLRLHKYISMFSNLSFDEMCKMKGEDMVSKGMTKGATKKLLLKLAQLKMVQFTGFPDMPGSGQIRRRSSTCSLPAALRLAEHPSPSPTFIDHHGSGVRRSISGYNLTGRGSRPNSDIIDDPSFLDHAILQAGPFIPTNAPPYNPPSETPPPDTMSIHSDTEIPPVQELIYQPSLQRKNAMRIRHNPNNPGELVMEYVIEDAGHMQQQQQQHLKLMGPPITSAAMLPQMNPPPMHFTNHPHPQNPNWPGHMIPGARPGMLPPNIQYHPIRQPGGQPIPQFPAAVNGLPGGMIRPFPPQISFVPNHIQPTAGFPPQFPPRGNNAALVMCCNCGQHGHIGAQCNHATPDNQNKSFHRSLRQSFSNPPNLNANNSKLL